MAIYAYTYWGAADVIPTLDVPEEVPKDEVAGQVGSNSDPSLLTWPFDKIRRARAPGERAGEREVQSSTIKVRKVTRYGREGGPAREIAK